MGIAYSNNTYYSIARLGVRSDGARFLESSTHSTSAQNPSVSPWILKLHSTVSRAEQQLLARANVAQSRCCGGLLSRGKRLGRNGESR